MDVNALENSNTMTFVTHMREDIYNLSRYYVAEAYSMVLVKWQGHSC
jgi:hypothetical protein